MKSKAQRMAAASAVVATSLLCAGGCSSFKRQWRDTVDLPVDTGSLAGRWTGTWKSEASGHHDQLRCIIKPASDGHYLARFHARYRKVIPFTFGYSVALTATQIEGTNHFHGEANLGWLAGGVYTYTGTATSNSFIAGYDSKYDHGTFQMSRPER